MSARRTSPRWPIYRWECRDCEQFEEPQRDLRLVRRHATVHAEDEQHNVTVVQITEWIDTTEDE